MRGTEGDGHDRSHTGGRDPQHDRNYPRSKRRQDDRDRREQHYRQDRDPGYNGRNKEMDSRSHQSPSDYRDPHSQEARQPRQGSLEMYTEASPSPTEMDQYEPQPRQALYNLRYLLTARGLCQVMEVLLNMLIVICAGVSYSSSGGYRDLASLGGIYAYYFGGASAFTGAEADRVKELDAQFYQLKLPPYIFSMACGGALMGYACAMLVLGVLRVPFRWPIVLLVEAVVDGLIGLGYIPALAFYFIKLQENYNSAICKEREQMYQSKGHQGFECKLHGADIGGGLFGVLGIIAFPFSAVLAIRAFRTVRERKRRKAQRDP
ncbi:MARVEL domain-containing protein 3 [Megalops cyprinoides]|uniref:MARVEL domain-containing protein 3 n=1 Tax=Megalops cyprinoides TaxID=118141 RepID=UPI00186498BA|nr:MARVEL domain-containing protein 3 [Megalops cyprinoides]XP_036391416.1 MARVEL domain-containing protein 3 [Megalops cyprinoides]XP_036391417.1 MARVEL domain-containing protein 3 [Megalops cyprinoides]XP_036391418.1 MARVEL domain-containing protein 3 [Megalops cyprinoides]